MTVPWCVVFDGTNFSVAMEGDVRGTRIQVRRHRIESKHVTTEDIASDKKDTEDVADHSTGAARVAESLAVLDSKKVQHWNCAV
jgi:hypothetical protein